jgi:hypothetical protein
MKTCNGGSPSFHLNRLDSCFVLPAPCPPLGVRCCFFLLKYGVFLCVCGIRHTHISTYPRTVLCTTVNSVISQSRMGKVVADFPCHFVLIYEIYFKTAANQSTLHIHTRVCVEGQSIWHAYLGYAIFNNNMASTQKHTHWKSRGPYGESAHLTIYIRRYAFHSCVSPSTCTYAHDVCTYTQTWFSSDCLCLSLCWL